MAAKAQYPELDDIYLATGCIEERKQLIEDLWNDYAPYADSNFLVEAKSKDRFNERSWELYLGATLLRRGYTLHPHKGEGPDFNIKTQDGLDVWVEATAPGRGVADPVPPRPQIRPGEIYSGGGSIEEGARPKVLRITQAILDKQRQYENHVRKGIVKEGDPYIVAINGHDFSGIAEHQDYLVRWAFFAGGLIQYKLLANGELDKPTLAYSPKVEKRTEGGVGEIECGLFTDDRYKDISAVIFTMDHVINAPREAPIGSNLIYARNPYARNKLPDRFWKIGREWVFSEGRFNCISHDDVAVPGF